MNAKNSLIEILHQELLTNYDDIKVEVLLSNALENDLSPDNFVIACDGFFFRTYTKDILFAELNEDAGKKCFLQIHLTRCGLYNHLPEGLFYKQDKSVSPTFSAKEMAAEYKINKRKEQEIRRFFVPFENEFFWHRILLEKEEVQLLNDCESGHLEDCFIRFWNLPPNLPSYLIARFIKLLPYASQLSGKIEFLTQCLQIFLQEPVRIKIKPTNTSKAEQRCLQPLNNWQLGINTTLGDQFPEEQLIAECTIGPLQHSHITNYLAGGQTEQFLSVFYEYFLPVYADVITNIEIDRDKCNFLLIDEEATVLGYSSLI